MLRNRLPTRHERFPQHRSARRPRCSFSVLALPSAQQDTQEDVRLRQASKDLRPYMVWDRVMKLQASWDTRSQADFQGICKILQPRALGKIIISKAEDMDGQPLTSVTVVCKPEDGDDVAAALLQWTPATHITASESEQCYLPQCNIPVTTTHGTIDVQLSLAGSTVRKVTPNWQQCQAAAEAAAAAAAAGSSDGSGSSGSSNGQEAGVIDAAAVAAAAVDALHEGLQDGAIKLDASLMF